MPHTSARFDAAAQADLTACRAALREGSYTFYAASLVLPASVREPACALYAFCREADDAVDQGADAALAVQQLRERLDRVYAGEACGPLTRVADRALASVVLRFGIPRAMLDALIEGFEWDVQGRSYDTLDALSDYAARVAGSVGAMMALLMGVREPQALARACDLGVAMQLSNIARDVGEDARMGRLYLPRAWMREAGLDPQAWLLAPSFSPALAQVVQRLLSAADTLYRQVDAGVASLPLACRPGINAARFLYAGIGHEVLRRGGDSVRQRAVVPGWRKSWLIAQSLYRIYPSQALASEPCLPANRFLVEAAQATAPVLEPVVNSPAWWRVDHRVEERAGFVLSLFERLEREERQPATLWPQR